MDKFYSLSFLSQLQFLNLLSFIGRSAIKQMQPILTADSFRHNSGDFQVQLVCASFSDAVKTADLSDTEQGNQIDQMINKFQFD